jgi:predicted nuclease of predicted toxin-antitoxin system
MVDLYLDEDINILVATLLRARNIIVTTTMGNKMLGSSDDAQLEYAAANKLSIVTHNRVDFENLYRVYAETNRNHSGIIVLIRRDVYDMSRRLAKFSLTHETIPNQLWYV